MEQAGWLCSSPVGAPSIGKFLLMAFLAQLLSCSCKAHVSIDKIIVPDILFEEEPPTLHNGNHHQHAASEAKFDCLYSYDKILDQNLVVKWYYEDDPEPIYQWIPELNKRFVSVKFRSHILINNNMDTTNISEDEQQPQQFHSHSNSPQQSLNNTHDDNPTRRQHHQPTTSDEHKFRGFILTKPSKELSGKYTCTVMSALNDDSKSKKMMVYALPRLFSFNAIRHQRDSGALQPHQLLQTMGPSMGIANQQQQQQPWLEPVPVPYRLRQPMMQPPSNHSVKPTSTTNAANVRSNTRFNIPTQMPAATTTTTAAIFNAPTMPSQLGNNYQQHQSRHQTQQQLQEYLQRLQTTGRVPMPQRTNSPQTAATWPTNKANNVVVGPQANGALLVCDIDQVYPMPEVSIYRLGKAGNGAHPGPSLLKLDTRVERVRSIMGPPTSTIGGQPQQQQQTGSAYHVQVTSFVDDDELIARYGQGPSYFECLITLPNLESTRYDSKRTIIYSPGSAISSSRQLSDTTTSGDSTSSSSMMTANGSRPFSLLPSATIITMLISTAITITISTLSPFLLISLS